MTDEADLARRLALIEKRERAHAETVERWQRQQAREREALDAERDAWLRERETAMEPRAEFEAWRDGQNRALARREHLLVSREAAAELARRRYGTAIRLAREMARRLKARREQIEVRIVSREQEIEKREAELSAWAATLRDWERQRLDEATLRSLARQAAADRAAAEAANAERKRLLRAISRARRELRIERATKTQAERAERAAAKQAA